MPQLAGYQTSRSVTPRQVKMDSEHVIQIGGVLDSTNSIDGSNTGYTNYIRGGWLLGQNSTSKKWTPLKRTKVAQNTESSSAGGNTTWFFVDNAAAFKVGDEIDILNGTTLAVVHNDLSITDINYTTNKIKVDDNVNVSADQIVISTDGAGTCKGVLLDDEVILLNQEKTAAADKDVNILIFGYVNSNVILGDVTAALEDSTAALYHLAGIRFSTNYT